MADRSARTWTVLGLVVAAIGVATPIIWDQYKTKSSLELQVISRATIVQRVDVVKKLEISYAGKPVPSISRIEFVLLNSGRTPLKLQDLVGTPTLKFSRNFEILDFEPIERNPKNLEVELVVDRDTNTARVTFPLLNPSDYFRFALIVAGTNPEFTASARVVGVRNLVITNRSENRPPVRVSWPVYVAAVFSLLSLIPVGIAIKDIRTDNRLRSKLAQGTLFPKHSMTKAEFAAFIEDAFAHRSDLEPLRKQVAALPEDNKALTDDVIKNLQAATEAILKSSGGAGPGGFIFGIIAIVGLVYVFWYLL